MNYLPSPTLRPKRLMTTRMIWIYFLSLVLSLSAAPETTNTGTVSGRVFNPAQNEYVQNAQIQIANGSQTAMSGEGGYYRLSNVPSGKVVVEVSFTGYRTEKAEINVTEGQTSVHDFAIISTLVQAPTEGQPVQLSAFVVTDAREGEAKAIMQQRQSMNITDSVASDVLGENSVGNLTETLKYMPGAELQMAGDQGRFIRLRGLDASYTGVTIDGVALASADANSAGTVNSRAFTFEQVSLSSMEAIEINYTISADQDASAPAGTINLKTKRGFDREGQVISWQANVSAMSEDFNLSKTLGPDDERAHRNVLPGGILEYSNVFLKKRLGIMVNVSESNETAPDVSTAMTYNTTSTVADPRPAVLTGIAALQTHRIYERFTATTTADFKATDNLTLSLGYIYNYFDLWSPAHNVTFNFGSRSAVAGADSLTSVSTTGGSGTVSLVQDGTSKIGNTVTLLPKFEYKIDDVTINGLFSYSISQNIYRPEQRRSEFEGSAVSALTGVDFTATRSSDTSADWQMKQTAGPDWSNLANYLNPHVAGDSRHMIQGLFGGEVNAATDTHWAFPISWKIGVKSEESDTAYTSFRDYSQFSYIGPGGGPTGSWAAYPSNYVYDLSMTNSHLTSDTGNTNITFPSLQNIYQLYLAHPEYFVNSATPAQYLASYVTNNKRYKEMIAAAYLMATAKIGKLQLRAGLRDEDTRTDSREYNPLPTAQVLAAGYTLSAGQATTIPGIQYQYLTLPQVTRLGKYNDLFPSVSGKYALSDNLTITAGYSHTIRRPTFNDVTGLTVIDSTAQTVTLPNPNLTPEHSNNFDTRIAYYFEPVGVLSVDLFENQTVGLRAQTTYTAAEFGYANDPILSTYTFISGFSSPIEQRVEGMQLEYSESLSFLPGPLKGLGVRLNYTRETSNTVRALLSPEASSGGLSYAIWRISANAMFTWTSDTPNNVTNTMFRRHRGVMDLGGGFKITDRTSFFFTASNIFNAPWINMQRVAGGPDLAQTYQSVGSKFIFGVKGTF